jgi:hypothetical protein
MMFVVNFLKINLRFTAMNLVYDKVILYVTKLRTIEKALKVKKREEIFSALMFSITIYKSSISYFQHHHE